MNNFRFYRPFYDFNNTWLAVDHNLTWSYATQFYYRLFWDIRGGEVNSEEHLAQGRLDYDYE